MNWNNFLGFYSRGFCPVSENSSNKNLNFIAYLESTPQDEKIDGWHVTGGGRTRPHAPPRTLSTTAREGHAPDQKPIWLADVMLTSA